MAKKMKVTKSLGMLLLGIWLILTGLLQVVNLGIGGLDVIMALLAIVAGALVILGR